MTTPEERDAIEAERGWTEDAQVEILTLSASLDAAIDRADAAHDALAELRAALAWAEAQRTHLEQLIFAFNRAPLGSPAECDALDAMAQIGIGEAGDIESYWSEFRADLDA